MLDREENLKDTEKDILKDSLALSSSYGIKSFHSSSYTKASKLITALYMVTDVIDKEDPIRNKLRKLGTEIVSDIHANPFEAVNKISETVAFLNIASTMSLISEMNCNILKKEFADLNNRIKEYLTVNPNWLEEFLINPPSVFTEEELPQSSIGHSNLYNGKSLQTRIGVQKGSTLMKALSDKSLVHSFGHPPAPSSNLRAPNPSTNNFDLVKKQRRDDIARILRGNEGGLTITDIKTKAKELPKPAESIVSCGEKTLQRELVSMVKDNILNRTGSKRWSRYFLTK